MLIDLSHPLNEQTPVYPGDPATVIASAGILQRDGFCDHYVSIGTHVGTHIDAPMHMLPGGKQLNDFPLEHFVGDGVLIDVRSGYEAVKLASIKTGDIVLLYSGASENYLKPSYYKNYPAIPHHIADYLVQQKIKMVGLDACSPDNTDGFPIHKVLLSNDILVIENLTNLASLAGKQFRIYALPINLQLDAGPARVIAETA